MSTSELTLDQYQKDAVQFLRPLDSGLLFADCGVGKTVTTLELLRRWAYEGEIKGVLIVAPLRVARLTWPLEIEAFKSFSWMRYTILHGPDKDQRLQLKRFAYLINYEGLMWLRDALPKNVKHWPFDTVVWDESTFMKNPDSKRFRVWRSALRHFHKRVALTGTPTPNSYGDLWAQVFCVDSGKHLGSSITQYREQYMTPCGYNNRSYAIRSKECERLVQDRIADITYRIDRKDHLDIPPCSVIDVECKLSKNTRKHYDEMESELFTYLDNVEAGVEAFNTGVAMGKCLQVAGGALYYDEAHNWELIGGEKLGQVQKIRKQHMSEPVILVYAFRHELARLKELYPGAVELRSGMSDKQERDIQERWDAGEIPELITHPASAGYGLNLQKSCRVLIWCTLSWSLERFQQMNYRIDRRGQKHPTTVYRMIAADTVDEVVATALERKDKSQQGLLDALKQYKRGKI